VTTFEGLANRVERTFRGLPRFEWVAVLAMRLFIGYFFAETGWGKIHNLEGMTKRFMEWGIPFPAFNAALSGYAEFLGGVFVMAGFMVRFVSLPLAFNMLVAIVSVKLKSVTDLSSFVELDEPLYGLVFVWMFFTGAGPISVDALIQRWWSGRSLTARRE